MISEACDTTHTVRHLRKVASSRRVVSSTGVEELRHFARDLRDFFNFRFRLNFIPQPLQETTDQEMERTLVVGPEADGSGFHDFDFRVQDDVPHRLDPRIDSEQHFSP